MSGKKFVVCLLALAGGALCFSPFRNIRGRFSPQRGRFRTPASHSRIPLSLPVTFEPQLGRAPADVQFVARARGVDVMLDGDGFVFALGPSASGMRGSDGAVRMRLVQASGGSRTKWKKISPNGSSNQGTGRKRGSHSSGWHKRSRPQHWHDLRNESSGRAKAGSRKGRKRIAWHGAEKLRSRANYFLGND